MIPTAREIGPGGRTDYIRQVLGKAATDEQVALIAKHGLVPKVVHERFEQPKVLRTYFGPKMVQAKTVVQLCRVEDGRLGPALRQGWSHCSVADQFSRHRGLQIALGRACNVLRQEEEEA